MSHLRDLTDPAQVADGVDPEAGLKEPVPENVRVPEELGPVTLVVDDYRVKRFAFTQDDYHPWHFDTSPFGCRVAQAGLLTNDLVQLFTTRYAASSTVGLHTEEQLWFENPVLLGEEVTLHGHYVDTYERRGQEYVVMEANATGEDGRMLLRHRGVEILRTVPGEVAGRATTEGSDSGNRVSASFDTSLPYVHKADGKLRRGMPVWPLRKQVTQEQASVFSRAGEYVRNIHNDLPTARAADLKAPIVQGQQQACFVTELMTRVFGAEWFTKGWFRCKFIRPVQVFEEVSVGGVITNLHEEGGKTRWADLDIWVMRQDGELSTVGWVQSAITPGL